MLAQLSRGTKVAGNVTDAAAKPGGSLARTQAPVPAAAVGAAAVQRRVALRTGTAKTR